MSTKKENQALAITDPQGTDPQATALQGTDPQGTDPQGTDPQGTDPQGTDPQATAPATKESKKTKSKVKEADELVPVFIPKSNRNDTERFVAVNGERILIQTGKTVKVPKKFAEVINNSLKAEAEADAYINSNTSV